MGDGLSGNTLENNFITVKCPFCGVEECSQFRTISDIVKCSNCGTVYLRTRFDDETHKELYQKRTNDVLSNLLPANDLEIQEKIKERDDFINEILEFTEAKGKLIDIGSSCGAFLFACSEKGFDVEGIEPAEELRNFAIENFNLNINENDFLEIDYPENSIDVITSVFSLQTLSNPKKVIEKIFKILKPEGLFCGILSNINSIASEIFEDDWEGIEPYKNTVYFSAETLEKHLLDLGFEIKKIYTDFGNFDQDLLIDIILDNHNPEDKIDIPEEIKNIAEQNRAEKIIFFAVKPEIIDNINIDANEFQDLDEGETDETTPTIIENIEEKELEEIPQEEIISEELPKTNKEKANIFEIELKPDDNYESLISEYFVSNRHDGKLVLIDKYNLVPDFADNWNGIEIIRKEPEIDLSNSKEENIKELQGETNDYKTENLGMNRIAFDEDLNYGFSNKIAKGKLPDVLPSPLFLNLGCGNDIRDGFLNLDLFSNDDSVIKTDVRKLEFADESVDLILANDILEHFSHREIDSILKEWARVLKPEGTLLIRCPSLKLQAKAYLEGKWNADIASYMIFGGQTNRGDYHCVAFDEESISRHLNQAGFEIIELLEEDIPQDKGFINLNMNVKAIKMKININEKKEKSTGLFTGFNFSDEEENQTMGKDNKSVEQASKAELNIVWEGDQFVYHSLALINREHCSNIIDTGLAELTIVPYGEDKFNPKGNEKYEKLLSYDIRVKQANKETEDLPYVWIRHQWPTKAEDPKGAKWIIMQPWEYSRIWESTARIFKRADEIWTPSNYSRQAFINSGIDFNKVQIIPNGINPEIFKPTGDKFNLATKKKFKFLFVGGTIWRKGIDIVLEAYKSVFKPEDDVCLVIKDLGNDSFYKGMDASDKIKEFMNDSTFPEIEYINEELSENEIADLYRSCDVLLNPYRGEGFSLPTIEAMACGLPVIVTQGGATDDYCDEQTAWLIPSNEKSIGNEIDGEELTDEAFVLEPDIEVLIQILRIIFDRPNEILTAGILASHRARTNWTWKKATIKIFSRLDYLYKKNLAEKAEKILIDEKDSSVLVGEAELNFVMNNFQGAEKLYKKASDMGGLSKKWGIHSLHRIAEININNLNFEEAEKYLGKTKNENQFRVDNLYLQAILLFKKNELVESLEILTEIMNHWQTFKYQTTIGISLDRVLCDTGNILLNMKDIENSLNIFKQALKINENSAFACLGAAKCFIEIDAIDDAKKMLDWAIKLDPTLSEAKELLKQL